MEQGYTFSIHIQENDNEIQPLNINFVHNDSSTSDNNTQITNNNMYIHQTINMNTCDTTEIVRSLQSSERFKIIMQEMLSMMVRRIDELNSSNNEIIENTITLEEYRSKIKSSKGTDKNRTCAICLEELNPGRKWHSPKCGHYFHPRCLQKYLTKKCSTPTCPVCRTSV